MPIWMWVCFITAILSVLYFMGVCELLFDIIIWMFQALASFHDNDDDGW